MTSWTAGSRSSGSLDRVLLRQLCLSARSSIGDDPLLNDLDGLGCRGVGVGSAGDLVEVVADARDLPGALSLHFGVRHSPGAHPANRPAQQIRQRQPCGACLGVPLGTLPLAGADLHPHGASSAPHVPLPLGGSEGAQPPASPCRGPAKRGPKGYAEYPRLKSRQGIT